MDRGYGTAASYLSCLQFFIAPTNLQGTNPDPSVRPQAVGNSYGCTYEEGCAGDEFTEGLCFPSFFLSFLLFSSVLFSMSLTMLGFCVNSPRSHQGCWNFHER